MLAAPITRPHRKASAPRTDMPSLRRALPPLQRALGNQAQLRRLALQAKLVIGPADDPLEHQADRVADQIMGLPAPMGLGAAPPQVSRKCAACEQETERLQRKGGAGPEPAAPALVEDVVRSEGQPLDRAAAADLGGRFGEDFSAVRVHADARAAASAEAVNALAYTVGHHIVFAPGQYRPGSDGGRHLLAHELTHVLQQSGGAGAARSSQPQAETAAPTTGAAPMVQRYGHTNSCTTSDLTGVVWPGDAAMRTMLAKVIRVLSASPIDPSVTALFPKYFMTASPPVATILGVYNAVQTVVTGSNYMYECEHDCGADEAAYVRDRLRYIGINPNIHVCINWMSGYTTDCNASLILHELTHYASHLDDEEPVCGACSTTGCPASLSPSDALDNTYSYADFALEVYALPI